MMLLQMSQFPRPSLKVSNNCFFYFADAQQCRITTGQTKNVLTVPFNVQMEKPKINGWIKKMKIKYMRKNMMIMISMKKIILFRITMMGLIVKYMKVTREQLYRWFQPLKIFKGRQLMLNSIYLLFLVYEKRTDHNTDVNTCSVINQSQCPFYGLQYWLFENCQVSSRRM